MTLKTKLKQIQSRKLTAVQNVMNFSKKIATPKSKDLNIFLQLNEDAIEQAKAIDKKIKTGKAGKLAGLCFAIKANISVKHMTISCASKTLEDYTGPFNATVVNKLLHEDAILLGMLNMDEFACGASGETSAFGPCKNPTNPELIPGGSSSGPAAAIAATLADFTLGSDTGGSIRNPASHCGVTGLKPTYGAVSRYGLLDLAMSFDVIGPLTKTVSDAKLIFDIIKGQDNFDQTTSDAPKELPKHKGVIGLVNIKNFATPEIANLIEQQTKEIAKQNNWKIKKVDLPLDIALETYYIIAYTEFFSGTRKFDGRRFGKKIEDSAGPEVLRRIIGGSEITKAEHDGKYYREALKARNYIKLQFQKIFSEVDAIILPTSPKLPHKIGDSISVEDMYAYDVTTVLASIAGLPAISIPAGKIEEKNVGLQIIAPHFQEDLLFKLAKNFETIPN
jgi:aspartyl-tRNA(Asn)/glutamyl-tRNA(Gln) amidotransferase subunit A